MLLQYRILNKGQLKNIWAFIFNQRQALRKYFLREYFVPLKWIRQAKLDSVAQWLGRRFRNPKMSIQIWLERVKAINMNTVLLFFLPITFGVWSQFFPNLFSGHWQKYVCKASRHVAPLAQGFESQNLWTGAGGGAAAGGEGGGGGGRGGATLGGPIVVGKYHTSANDWTCEYTKAWKNFLQLLVRCCLPKHGIAQPNALCSGDQEIQATPLLS